MALSYVEQLDQAVQYMQQQMGGKQPKIGLVLGSGLGDLAKEVEQATVIPFGSIPHMPVSTVEGHAGQFVIGQLEGKTVVVMQGRFHYYEGYTMRQVVFPIYVMRRLGVQLVVMTNAAGGMNRAFRPGDLMLICDHLNLTGDHPLIGPNEQRLGPRFPDMSEAYSKSLRELAHRLSSHIRSDDGTALELQEGVYCGISGPSYMTAAELTMLSRLGGDAVGMSTVAEVIAARHSGMDVLGISCITDMAIGEELEPLSHEQVMEVADRTKPKFIALVKSFVRQVQVQS